MKARASVLMCAVALIAIAGCAADLKAASKENFYRAIATYLGSNKVPACIGPFRDPEVVDSNHRFAMLLGFWSNTEIQQWKALRAAGLVRTTGAGIQARYRTTAYGKGFAVSQDLGKSPYLGEELFRRSFCFGRLGIASVSSFTEPADMMGQRISTVTFIPKLADQAPWASAPVMIAAFPDQIGVFVQQRPETITLVATSEGWQVVRN